MDNHVFFSCAGVGIQLNTGVVTWQLVSSITTANLNGLVADVFVRE